MKETVFRGSDEGCLSQPRVKKKEKRHNYISFSNFKDLVNRDFHLPQLLPEG